MAEAPGKKGKARKGASKDKATSIDPAPSPPAKPCALCDVVGHATHTCPELPHIQPMVKVAFPESTVSGPSLPSSSVTKNPKTIRTSKPCALCGIHGHYSHHCPHLMHYRTSLEVVREYEVEQNQSASPILAQYASGQLEDPPAPIDIPPPDVQMTESTTTILYLSSFARPLEPSPSAPSPVVSPDPLFSTHTRDHSTRISVDLRSPSPRYASYSPHISPSSLYMSHSHPAHHTPSRSCLSMSSVHSRCRHYIFSPHFLSCNTIP